MVPDGALVLRTSGHHRLARSSIPGCGAEDLRCRSWEKKVQGDLTERNAERNAERHAEMLAELCVTRNELKVGVSLPAHVEHFRNTGLGS